MDPLSIMIGLTIASYVVGGVATDAVAVAQRRDELPSTEKARARHERKRERGEQSNPAPSYLGRVVGNAAERWAAKSDQRHADRLAWIEEQKDTRSQKWLDRKRKRAGQYERAAQKVADKAGVAWGKTRDAVETARERRAENEAHRRNQSEPELIDRDDWHPDEPPEKSEADPDGPLADVLDFPPRREANEQDNQHDSDLPMLEFTERRRDDGSTELEAHPTDDPDHASNVRGDPADPTTWTGRDRHGRDIQTGRGGSSTDPAGGVVHDDDTYKFGSDVSPERNLVRQRQVERQRQQEQEELATTNPDTNSDTNPDPDTGFDVDMPPEKPDTRTFAEIARDELSPMSRLHESVTRFGPGGVPIVTTPALGVPRDSAHPSTTGESTMTEQTASAAEIASLQDVLTYTSSMRTKLGTIIQEAEGTATKFQALQTTATAAAQEVDNALADLHGKGVEGNHVRQLESASEELHSVSSSAATAAQKANEVEDATTNAQTAFTAAHQAFQAQTGLEEEIQAANASGNRAGHREFYENA